MQRDSANWQNDISITDNQLVTVGIDYYDDHGKIAPAFSPIQKQSLGNTAYFAQDQFSLVDNDFIIGLRRDNNYQYGDHNTGDFSWGRNLTKTLRMTASYGKGFRAPTFTDLYYPVFSNPNLDPEKSNSYEIGLKGNQQTFDWEANVYQIDIKDLIQWNSTLMMPDNLNKAQIQGLELASHAHIGPWRFGGNVTFLNPRDENTGYVLVGRAKRTLNLEVDRTFGKFDFGVSLIAQSQRYDDAANTETLSGYGSVDVRGTYHVTSEFDVQLKVSNIFDRNYIVGIDNDPVFGYGDIHQDGTNAFLTVTYTPHVK
jgi:vitamin B12 transporter